MDDSGPVYYTLGREITGEVNIIYIVEKSETFITWQWYGMCIVLTERSI